MISFLNYILKIWDHYVTIIDTYKAQFTDVFVRHQNLGSGLPGTLIRL